MTKRRRARVWVTAGVLVPAALTTAGAWAQQSSAPATDTFANNSSPAAVYQDQYSSSCDEKNGTSLAMDSPDPARCFDLPAATNGQCSTIGGEGSTLAGQTGNICHYCQGTGPLPGNEIVVPNESGGAALAAYQQGYVCSAHPGDSCYLTCYGTKKFTPPSSTTLKPGSGISETPPSGNGGPPPIKNANARSPLVGHLIYDAPDACHPAGVEQYNVCDYPNLPRPAGCTCSKTPEPETATQLKPPVMAQMTPDGSADSSCTPAGSVVPDFTPAEMATLKQDVADARAIVTLAKAFTDKVPWDAGTQTISKRYFGDASTATQAQVRQSVSQVLSQLNAINPGPNDNVLYPASTDTNMPDLDPGCVAYTQSSGGQIYLCPLFWKQLPTGENSQAMALVHEVSHWQGGASTLDYAYGQKKCRLLVYFTTDSVGKIVAQVNRDKLTKNGPSVADLTEKAPPLNADSFKYFVYDVAGQSTVDKNDAPLVGHQIP